MQMLLRVLHQDKFKLLATVPVTGTPERDESHLEIYQNLSPASQTKDLIRFELPAFGVTVEGKVGAKK